MRFGRTFIALVRMAAGNLVRFPLRTVVVLACLLAAAAPLLTALALQQGLKDQALATLDAGPDLLITGDDFGRPGAVPLEWTDIVRQAPGVVLVIPRAVGRVMIDDLPAILVGLGPAAGIEGAQRRHHPGMPELGAGELAVGSALARHYGIKKGDEMRLALPVEGPERFRYRSFVVTGLLDGPDSPVWSATLVRGSFADLQDIFLRHGMASELMVWCRSGYEQRISTELSRLLGPAARIQDRPMMETYYHAGFDRRGGAFLVLFLAALSLSIPVLALSSGLGLSARRREVAVLKSFGWETREVLLLQMIESVTIAMAGASLAVVLALAWLVFGSAWPLNAFLLPGAEELPLGRLPYRLAWAPVLMSYVYAVTVTACGAVVAAWRAAAADPGRILLGGEG